MQQPEYDIIKEGFDYYSFQDGVKVELSTINKWIEDSLKRLQTQECTYTHSGDTLIAGYNLGLKGDIKIFICTSKGVETLDKYK